MNADSELWRHVESALIHHRKQKSGDRDGLDVLNRLSREHAMRAEISTSTKLEPNTCEIRTVHMSTDQLRQKTVRWHDRANPGRLDGPLIAIEHNANFFLVDGANRLNYWIKENDTNEHAIILVSPR